MSLSNLINRYKIVSLTVLCMAAVCSRPLGADQPTADYPEKVLRVHGVAIKEHAVVAALQNVDPDVREAASAVLVKRWPKLAPSVIEQALGKEPDGFTRVRMATDLARIGDAAGRQALVKECHSRSDWASIKINAAAVLSEQFRDNSCLDSILDVLQSDSDPKDTGGKESALELAPDLIHHLPPEESHRVFGLVIKALGDSWPGVRATASLTLYGIGDSSALTSMNVAISKEKDEGIRLIMMNNLHNLESKTQIQQP
jgi:HEAT repeat protein